MTTKSKTVLRCPHCGGSDIAPDEKTGKLKCKSCKQLIDAKSANAKGGVEKLSGRIIGEGSQKIIPGEDVVLTLKCSSCGAEVVINTDEALTAKCPWCRHILSVTDKLPNGAVPDLVLPFKLTRAEAHEKMKEFLTERLKYADPELEKNFSIDNIQGVFMPYVVIDMRVDAQLSGTGEELVRRYTVGSGDDEETRYDVNVYKVERVFELEVDDLTIEASSKRLNHDRRENTNNVISAIMPFDTENAVDWDPRYLRGFTSEKRDLDVDELDIKAKRQTEDILKYQLSSSLAKYDRGVCWDLVRLKQSGVKWKTAYLPVWLFSVAQQSGEKVILHYVAVNARTGETHGSVPMNKKKILMTIFLFPSIVLFLSLLLSLAIKTEMLPYALAIVLSPLRVVGVYASVIWFFVFGIIMLVKMRKYREKDARHDFEAETRAKITKLEENDELLEFVHGMHNSMMLDRNDNKKSDVDGSRKTTIEKKPQNSTRGQIIVGVIIAFLILELLGPILALIMMAFVW